MTFILILMAAVIALIAIGILAAKYIYKALFK